MYHPELIEVYPAVTGKEYYISAELARRLRG
jgi:hypothetical protein